MPDDNNHLTFTRPADRTLESYKTWIRNMMAAIGGGETMTEAEWEAAWREFWSDEPVERNGG